MNYNKLKTLRTFFLLLPTVFSAGCQKENAFDCFKSTGQVTEITRELPPFQDLRILDNLEVTLIAAPEYKVELKAGEHLLSNILTEVKHGELTLRNINRCNWVRSYDKPLEVRVFTPKIKNIVHDGDVTFRSEGFVPADTLFLHLNGAGDMDLELNTVYLWLDMYELGNMRLRGKNEELRASVLSFGNLQAADITNRNAYLKLTGEGAAHLQVSDYLGAEISGNGNVYYYSEPLKTERSGNGKGQVIKAK